MARGAAPVRTMAHKEAQSIAVKRAQVEFHNFASLGEPERAMRIYAEENRHRGALIDKHRDFVGRLSPFLEIGANAGHTSYLLANEYGADGFALDISADALRHGVALQDEWGMARAPVRVAGDALNLPFRDSSLRMVMAHQMLSQFLDIEAVFLQVKRVLAPGGIFFFSEEPLKRVLSLRLYRCPYYDTMKPWERKLYDWGLLGYVVRDVIGAHQEESFGIRQNHTMGLKDWQLLIEKHFGEQEYDVFVPRRGWGETVAADLARRVDRYRSDWLPARLLGGTLAAFCRKRGQETDSTGMPIGEFERFLRCPDCRGGLNRDSQETLRCGQCSYEAALEGGVYNLLPSADKRELYPGDREDLIDFSRPGHESHLGEGFWELEGVFGNKYRWIGPRATARLRRVKDVPQLLRIRGHVSEPFLHQGRTPTIEARVNGVRAGHWKIDRTGLFILEAPVAPHPEYDIEIAAAPAWQAPGDNRVFTVTLSMIRLVDA
jgi:ubiquinone/menaquinone biosynthesis C-methylase UbiE